MNNNSRTKNSFYNMIAAVFANVLAIIIGIVARAIFVKILDSEYLGLNGLFTNIVSMLGIVELGIGNAIIYNLYKPIADNDIETIKSLMRFYRKSYHIIGIVVLVAGIIIIPFLPYIIGTVTIDININIIYLMFLIDIVFSYFLSYKRSILYANQKNYIVNIIHIGYILLMNFLQIFILYMTKNYYLYLIIKILMRIVENLVITFVVNNMYSFLNSKNVLKLDKNIEKDIFKKVKALFLHQIGSFIINGTDNIIISKYLGLITVGLYSNYYLIINSIQTVSKQVIEATTPSIGNMLVTEDINKQFIVFKRIRFANFWVTTICGVGILTVMEPFIKVWIGKKFLLSTTVLAVLVINFYQKNSRYAYSSFKSAAGIFYEDRFVPIIESILNILFSIIFVKLIGLSGVFIGTIFSGFALWCYSYPKYVYKKLFNRSYIDYIKETLAYILIFLLICIMTYYISSIIVFNNLWLKIILNLLVTLIISNFVIVIIFKNSDNYQYYIKLLKSALFKRKNVNV